MPTRRRPRRPRSSRAAAPTAGGTAGTGANIPTYRRSAAGAGGNSNYKRKTTSKTTSASTRPSRDTQVAPGAVNKLNVALMVDKSVPTATVNALKQTVAAAAGIDPKRGDT